MDQVTRLKCMAYNNYDSRKTPLCSKLLEYLEIQVLHFESVTSTWKLKTTTCRSYAMKVERECVAIGKGGNHPLGACSKFQGML